MKTTALICSESQAFSLDEVELPDPGAGEMAVRTLYSGVSIGTEFALIRNKISWGPYPICTGYQGVGAVERVGKDLNGFTVGDRVYYRQNPAMRLAGGTPVTAASGVHCAHAVVSPSGDHGAALLPEGVGADVASMFVMPAVGLYGVDLSNPRMGDTVVVYGVGLIGLGVVGACAHRGCEVIAVDLDPARLEMARKLGADHLIDGSTEDAEKAVKRIAPRGADVVFEATGIPACIDKAIALARPLGKFVWQGNYGEAPIAMHFLPPHGKRLTMFFPCDDGLVPCRRAVLKNMAMGALKWEHTITHRVEAGDAPALFDRINKGNAPGVIGAVIHWPD